MSHAAWDIDLESEILRLAEEEDDENGRVAASGKWKLSAADGWRRYWRSRRATLATGAAGGSATPEVLKVLPMKPPQRRSES